MDRLYLATREAFECHVRAGDGWSSQRATPAPSLECVAAHRRRPRRVFCGSFDGGLHRSADGGRTFERVGAETIHEEAVMSLAIDPSDPDVVLAGTEPSALYRSTDGGDTWSQIEGVTAVPSAEHWSFPPRPETHHVRWVEIAPADPERWYVGIEAGALLLTPDGGETWVDRPDGSRRDNHWLATHADAPDRVFAAAGDGYAESHDAGLTWTHPQDGLDHRYVWSIAVDRGDPDTRLVSAASGASRAHRSGTAESYVYRRMGDAAWERLDGRGLPMGDGVLRPVLARGDVPGTFVAASNRGAFATEDAGDQWRPLGIDATVIEDRQPVRGLVCL